MKLKNEISRRQFLSRGILGFSATLLSPTLLGLLESQFLQAEESTPARGSSHVPFLIFDCAGGAALAGNFLVGMEGDPHKLLPSYSTLGWNPHRDGYDDSFGLPMAHVSGIRKGIYDNASLEARKNLRMGGFCHFSQDDTPFNPLSPYFLLAQWGYSGTLLSKGIGTYNSLSGGYANGVLSNLSFKTVYIDSLETFAGNLIPPGPLGELKPRKLANLLKTSRTLSRGQLRKFEESPDGKLLTQQLEHAHSQNLLVAQTPYEHDPRKDPLLKDIYKLQDKPSNDQDVVFSCIVKGVLTGNTGPGVLTFANCDYHTGSPAAGDKKDYEVGQHIGRAIEAASRLSTPLFFCLFTDGANYSDLHTRNWRGDAGDKGMTVIGYFDPSGNSSKMRRLQGGSFTSGQSADLTTTIGRRPDRVACAVFGNYLNAQNRIGEFEQIVSNGLLSREELEELLIFG